MLPHYNYEIARYRMVDAQRRAATDRIRLAARNGAIASAHAPGVIHAVGHGLIAIGTRMISDPADRPSHRRAA